MEDVCWRCKGGGIIWRYCACKECPECRGSGWQETVRDITKQYDNLRRLAWFILSDGPGDREKAIAELQEALR